MTAQTNQLKESQAFNEPDSEQTIPSEQSQLHREK